MSQYFRRICVMEKMSENVVKIDCSSAVLCCAVQKNTIQKSGKFVNWVHCWIKIKYKNIDSSQMRRVYIKWEHDESE